jgi:hypothetical protein
MPFIRQKIDEEYEPIVASIATPLWHSYGGNWAIDTTTNDCLFFDGCDQLDSSVPSTFVMLVNQRKTRLWLDVISSNNVPGLFREKHAKFQDSQTSFFAVLKNGEASAVSDVNSQERAREAFCVLTGKEVHMTFFPNWNQLHEIQKQFEKAQGIALASQSNNHPPSHSIVTWVSNFWKKQ